MKVLSIQERRERGVALVMTLSMLVIASILVIAFITSMRTERQAASSMAHNERAKIVAQSALDHAISLLEKNIPSPLPPGTPPTAQNWSVAPGQLLVSGSAISLTSGPATSDADANLNIALLSGGGYMILPTSTPMRVAWQNVLQDPAAVSGASNKLTARYAFWVDDENSKINFSTAYGKPANAAGYNLDNPFTVTWTDPWGYSNSGDEHLSFTYGAPNFQIPAPAAGDPAVYSPVNPFSLGHPASINLDLMSGLDRNALWTFALNRRFQSPGEIKQFVTGNSDAFLNTHKFSLTHWNGDPEFNAFGKSRIFLAYDTASQNGAAGGLVRYGSVGFTYVNESSSSMTVRDATEPLTFHSSLMNCKNDLDPVTGAIGGSSASTSAQRASNLNGVQVTGNPAATAVARVAQYLNSSWPGYSGTFVNKWGQREADQVAWNLYGMAALSTLPGGQGGAGMRDGSWANTTFFSRQTGVTRFSRFLWDGPLSGARILPQTRSAYISKFGIQVYATQRNKNGTKNSAGTTGNGYVPHPVTGTSIEDTTKYVLSFRFQPEIMLPKNYAGYNELATNRAEGLEFGAGPDRVYVTHFEATIDDGSGSGDQVVKWCSQKLIDDGSLYWDTSGGYGSMKNFGAAQSPSKKFVMPGDYRTFRVDLAEGANSCDFSSYDINGSRALNFIFDRTSTTQPRACTIKNMKLRFVAATAISNNTNMVPYQISPIRDIDGALGFEPATSSDSGVIIFPQFTVDTDQGSLDAPLQTWACMETTDPRVNQRGSTPGAVAASVPPSTDDWQPSAAGYGTVLGSVTLGQRAARLGPFPATGLHGDESKCASFDSSPLSTGSNTTFSGGYPSTTNRRLPSVGWLSNVSTGIQRGHAWSTLRFQKGAASVSPPDWLLMDLFAVPYNAVDFQFGRVIPNATLPQPLTYMNSTAGKININALIFPNNAHFSLPQNGTTKTRSMPILALLKNMYRPNVTNPNSATLIDDAAAGTLFDNIVTYLDAKPNKMFDYPGEICEVPGFADTGANEWEREALIRNLGSLITTRSNAFSVWGVAQTIKKVPANTGYGVFQVNDQITGEKRFRAIVERYVWPGVDQVAGNGSTYSGTTYAALGGSAWLGSMTNAVDAIDPTQTGFDQAFNPGAARMKYRVVYFEYLDL